VNQATLVPVLGAEAWPDHYRLITFSRRERREPELNRMNSREPEFLQYFQWVEPHYWILVPRFLLYTGEPENRNSYRNGLPFFPSPVLISRLSFTRVVSAALMSLVLPSTASRISS
jgi:hypothetical protein